MKFRAVLENRCVGQAIRFALHVKPNDELRLREHINENGLADVEVSIGASITPAPKPWAPKKFEPFDLARAQDGERVCAINGEPALQDMHFVGKDRAGLVVCEHRNGGFAPFRAEELCMLPREPKRQEFWVNVYEGLHCTVHEKRGESAILVAYHGADKTYPLIGRARVQFPPPALTDAVVDAAITAFDNNKGRRIEAWFVAIAGALGAMGIDFTTDGKQ
jgi:hypothetical protein